MATYAHLLQFEVGGIQSYIFEGGRLRDFRGASALLDHLNRDRVPALVRAEAGDDADILRSSGSVTVVGLRSRAPADTPRRLADAVRALYMAEAPGAALYHAVLADPPADAAAALRALSYAVALGQGDRPALDPDTTLLHPLIRFCDNCGVRPAERARRLGDTTELVCRACNVRSEFGLRVRRGRVPGSVLSRFARFVQDRPEWADVRLETAVPKDLSDLSIDGDIALLVADGNDLGRTLRHLPSFPAYESFSRALAGAVERAVFSVLAGHPPAQDRLLWEIVLLGGDDLAVVTAAPLGLKVAQAIVEAVEREAAPLFADRPELGRDTLTMALGMAVAPAHMPFTALYNLAHELEQSAKRRAREHATSGRPVSTVDFHRVRTSGHVSLAQVRAVEQRTLRPIPADDGRPALRPSLTQRPYTLEDLQRVVSVAEQWAVSRLPSSKLHALREHLMESPAEGMFAWAHVVGRARSEDERAAWLALEELGTGTPYLAPWLEGEDEHLRTYLLDVLDVLDLLPAFAAAPVSDVIA